MLKITIQERAEARRILLEGILAGPWVDELERTWLALIGKSPDYPVLVDLSGVTFVDGEGKKILSWIYEEGAELSGADVMNKAIIDEIKQKHGDARRVMQWFHRGRHGAKTASGRRGA